MKKIDKLRNYLLDNYINEFGNLDISGLDFSEFEGDVFINKMKVKGNLYQDYQYVKCELWQGNQIVEEELWQSNSTVQRNYSCVGIKVGGKIFTEEPKKILQKITREKLAEMGYEII